MRANLDLIDAAIAGATPEAVQEMLDDEGTVFWVDWREEDDVVVQYCEESLQTGRLTAEIVDDESPNGFKMYIKYGEKRGRVPLTYSGADRHITLLALNAMLRPDYEIRHCLDTIGNDTGGYVALAKMQWTELERRHGAKLFEVFGRLTVEDNPYA